MREIKFRIWDKQNNCMYYISGKSDVLHPPIGTTVLQFGDIEELDKNGVDWDTKEYELMQFTGLMDKNGKEIYEGDIVKYKYENSVLGYVKYHTERACYTFTDRIDERYYGLPIDEYIDGVWNPKDFEVIGNIYENSELIISD